MDSSTLNFQRKERIVLGSFHDDELFVRLESETVYRRPTRRHAGRESTSDTDTGMRFGHISHPLLSTDAVQLLSNYGAVRIHIQVASRSSDRYPDSPLDVASHQPFLGPPGVSVAVDFVQDKHHADEDTACRYYQSRFLALVQELVGRRRILVAPLGPSMSRNDLHRFVAVERHRVSVWFTPRNPRAGGGGADGAAAVPNETIAGTTTTTTRVTRVTTILPMAGAPAAFSMDGLRSFVQQATTRSTSSRTSSRTSTSNHISSTIPTCEGIWCLATPRTWSSWLLGSVPSTLEEAQAFMTSATHADVSHRPSMTHHRRGFWMEWTASPHCHASHPTSPSFTYSQDDCRLETKYGLQYAMALPRSADAATSVALCDVLPKSSLRNEAQSLTFQPDAFADESIIRLVGNLHFSQDVSCAMNQTKERNASAREIPTRHFLHQKYRTKSCLELRPRHPTPHSDMSTTVPPLSLPDPWWSVQYHVARTVGQAYRGALQIVLQNHETRCSATQVAVVQVLPHVLEPQWHSLVIFIQQEGSMRQKRLRWNELDDFNVDFQPNGSIRLSFQHSIPKQSSFELWLDYEPSFLSHEMFPGDANRGFEIPPVQATFSVDLDGTDACHGLLVATRADPVTLYSHSLLILAPLPDMSMPFNVISLTCTLYAFIIGSLLNLAIKKANAQLKAQLNPDNPQHQGLVKRLKAQFAKRFGKKQSTVETMAKEEGVGSDIPVVGQPK